MKTCFITETSTYPTITYHPCSLSLLKLSWGVLCRILIKNSNFIVAIKSCIFFQAWPSCNKQIMSCHLLVTSISLFLTIAISQILLAIFVVIFLRRISILGCDQWFQVTRNKYCCFTCLRHRPVQINKNTKRYLIEEMKKMWNNLRIIQKWKKKSPTIRSC